MTAEFVQVERDLMAAAQDIHGSGYAVYMSLADRCIGKWGKKYTACPSVGTIAEETGLPERTVQHALGVLKDTGWILPEPGRTRYRTISYVLVKRAPPEVVQKLLTLQPVAVQPSKHSAHPVAGLPRASSQSVADTPPSKPQLVASQGESGDLETDLVTLSKPEPEGVEDESEGQPSERSSAPSTTPDPEGVSDEEMRSPEHRVRAITEGAPLGLWAETMRKVNGRRARERAEAEARAERQPAGDATGAPGSEAPTHEGTTREPGEPRGEGERAPATRVGTPAGGEPPLSLRSPPLNRTATERAWWPAELEAVRLLPPPAPIGLFSLRPCNRTLLTGSVERGCRAQSLRDGEAGGCVPARPCTQRWARDDLFWSLNDRSQA